MGVSAPERAGALLRVDGSGYADVHPWPELGDAPLEEQLRGLAAGRLTPLTARAFATARLDALARLEGRSLFTKEKAVPRSHWLADLASASPAELARRAVDEGFEAIKLKVGADPALEARALAQLDEALRGREVRLRLDANERFERAAFEAWFSALPSTTRDRVAFVEDPYPFGAAAWAESGRRLGVKLALDRRVSEELPHAPGPLDADVIADEPEVWILKPARDDVDALASAAHAGLKRLVVTHSLDHPLGQAAAAFFAAECAAEHPLLVDLCGLKAADVYEADAFSEALVGPGPEFRAPEGTGLGFDAQLASLRWEKLV